MIEKNKLMYDFILDFVKAKESGRAICLSGFLKEMDKCNVLKVSDIFNFTNKKLEKLDKELYNKYRNCMWTSLYDSNERLDLVVKILKLVLRGLTVNKACNKEGISYNIFYTSYRYFDTSHDIVENCDLSEFNELNKKYKKLLNDNYRSIAYADFRKKCIMVAKERIDTKQSIGKILRKHNIDYTSYITFVGGSFAREDVDLYLEYVDLFKPILGTKRSTVSDDIYKEVIIKYINGGGFIKNLCEEYGISTMNLKNYINIYLPIVDKDLFLKYLEFKGSRKCHN